MKSLQQFILENSEIYRLTEVVAKYFVQPNEIMLQAPETYNESDIQIYIDDMWLKNLPSSENHAEKLFGVNKDSISDAHFEYDGFEHLEQEPNEYIEWDAKYDSKTSNEDIKLEYFKLKNLKYIITFDRFDMTNTDDDNVQNKLIDIFKAAESNDANKYSIEIRFDENSLKYIKSE